ncbi:MAG TPA: carboxypeptidase regulatory-like domain-containing protein [Candidatus Angelobacter sp.]|nr:carboxypeptidase regulatory-like domain-containing protein [Candidatus Angelobacter sp.]
MNRRLLAVVVVVWAVCVFGAESTAQKATTEKLPVRRVVLYKNGVGYFEHTGHVHGNQSLNIDFTSSQLNDVLKSLTVLDLDGGKISGVGYNSVAPVAEQLRSLRLPLEESTTLGDFLSALRGARVQVRNGAVVVSGRLLSVEQRTIGPKAKPKPQQDDEGQQEEEAKDKPATKSLAISIVTDAGEVRTFPITPALSVRVADRDMNEEISRYLNLVSSARDQDLRRMSISASGSGDRKLFVSYISEVPVWKSTYRILLPSKSDAKPILQGWAIVDNTVGEDWKDVQLSLVAGAPQSFVQELSKPYYTRRPVVELPQEAMLTPQTHEGTLVAPELVNSPSMKVASGVVGGVPGGISGGVIGALAAPPPSLANGSLPRFNGIYGLVRDANGAPVSNADIEAVDASDVSHSAHSDSSGNFRLELPPGKYEISVAATGFEEFTQSIQVSGNGSPSYVNYSLKVDTEAVDMASEAENQEAEATGETSGDLFEYKLKEKVTILKNHSALVPIINSHIEAEKVTLWSSSSTRPLRALWIRNTSGLTLDNGTFNVLDSNTFAGEGLLDSLKPKERRLLSYAIDQAVRIEHQNDVESSPVTHIKIAKGVMIETRQQRDHQMYTVRNSDSEPREVVLEHPVRQGWKLEKDLDPEETSASFYRFRVKVPPHETEELKIDEVQPLETTLALSTVSDDHIKLLVSEKTITPAIEQALRKIIAQKNDLAGLDRQIQQRQANITAIDRDQQRLRENMKALKGSVEEKALVERYTRELNNQEDKLQAVRAEITTLQQQREKSREQLDSMLQGLTMDETI